MSPDDVIRIRHILEAIDLASGFVGGRTSDELRSNAMLRLALTRAVEIVGEAAARVSPEGRAAASDLPWHAMVGMRNRLVHAYFDVDCEILWTTVTDSLPPLATRLRTLVPG